MITLETILGSFSYVFAVHMGMVVACGKKPRKKDFAWRAALWEAAVLLWRCVLVALLRQLHIDPTSPLRLLISSTNLSVAVLLGWSLHRCYEECNLWESFFFATIGCCLQYLTYKLYWLLTIFFVFDKIQETALIVGITCACYQAAWRLGFCRLDAGEALKMRHFQNLLAMLLAVVLIYSDSFLRFGAQAYNSLWVELVVWSLCVLMVIMDMLLAMSILLFFKIRDERDMLRQMLEQQREQYRLEQRNIELINIKCHDLRHMLRSRGAGLMDETLLNELADHISIYDARMDTGSDALTVVLDKYSMYCEQHGIRITCMIDGSLLNFIPAYKLYALFGNAVENAVKAVRRLDREKRVISISQQISGSLINIRIANYFDGQVTYENDLPVNRAENHGFGVKSIQLVAEEYGGSIHVQNTADLFILNILLPLRPPADGTAA